MSTTETESAATPPIPAPPASVWGPLPGPPAEVLHGGGSAAPTRQWLPAVIRTKLAAGLIAAGLLVGGGAGYAVGHSASAGGAVPAGQTGRPGGTNGQGGPGGFGGAPGQGTGQGTTQQGQSGTTGQSGQSS